MKPRERKEQAQTSRLYLRNADHRDVIYNDMYHNAMWANAGNVQDKLVWTKYPKNGLIMTYGGAGDRAGGHCWMDVDRQFQYGRGFAGGQRGRSAVYGLEKDGITVLYSQYGGATSNFSVTDDGIVWQDIDVRGANPSQETIWHFGEDGLCWIHTGEIHYEERYPYRAGFTVGTILFKKNEDTGKFEVECHQYSYPDKVNDCTFVCNTKQGFILYTTYGAPYDQSGTAGANNPTYWHIDHAGVKTQKHYSLWQTNPIFSSLRSNNENSYGFAYAKVGNRCFVIATVENGISRYSGDRYFRVHLLCSNDQGATWTGEKVFEYFRPMYSEDANFRIALYVRDGEVFAFWASNKSYGWKVHAYSTYTGTQWDEIALPSWLEVPVISGGGACIAQTSKETLKIAVDPQNTSGADINLAEMLKDPRFDMNLRSGSIMYRDGKMVKITDDVVWFHFGGNYAGTWNVYFNNRYLAENSKSFAWLGAYWNDTQNIPDYIQNGDYCVPYETIPFDPSPYAFWDYYEYISAEHRYVKVPRIELSHYSTYYLVVVEYLPTVGANNVLYKVPRYNV